MNVKLRIVGPNQTEIRIGEKLLFFSYETLVAVYVNGECFRTNETYSKITTKHLNNWCPDNCTFADSDTLQKLAES